MSRHRPPRRGVLYAIILGCLLCGLCTSVQSKSAAEISMQRETHVVLLRALNAQGQVDTTGSGVVLAAGTVITNCHVVEEAQEIEVFQAGKRTMATLQYADEMRDLCQLSAPGVLAEPLRLVPFSDLQVG